MAREALRAADPARFRDRIERADAWLGRLPNRERPRRLDRPARRGVADPPTDRGRAALDLLRAASRPTAAGARSRTRRPRRSTPPWPSSPSTATATGPASPAMIARGRAYLVATQQDDGSWTETTRPAGAESYAQRLSTTGWATLALLTVKSP